MGLGPSRAFLGRAAGRLPSPRQRADIDVGRAAAARSAVSGLGCARCSATACSTGGRTAADGSAASAAARGSAAPAASCSRTASASASTSAGRCAASTCACVGSRAGRPGYSGSTSSVVGSACRCAARVGPSGRSTWPGSGRARSVMGRSRGAARSLSPRRVMGGAGRVRPQLAIDRVAYA